MVCILSYPILSYPILSYPILSYPILSYPILSYPILSYHLISSHLISSHIISSHLISSHLISSHLIYLISSSRQEVEPTLRSSPELIWLAEYNSACVKSLHKFIGAPDDNNTITSKV